MTLTCAVSPELVVLDTDSTTRTTVIKPGMCGYNSLFVGQIGDWTWDTVTALCDTNVFAARDGGGAPTYLAFYYFHIRASERIHLRGLTFGDTLRVDSRAFGFGSESVLTLHEIRRGGGPSRRIDPDEFYAHPDPDCLYVQNFNRWVARGASGGNEGLRRASPSDFRHDHLPALPERYSPRLAYASLRARHGTAPPPGDRDALTVEYPIDVTRDLNGVGLLYFAAYFSIVDWALLRLWRHLGRTDEAFLRRVVVDQQLCYLGNADAGTVLRIDTSRRPVDGDPGGEHVQALLSDRNTGRPIAVGVQRVRIEGAA